MLEWHYCFIAGLTGEARRQALRDMGEGMY